MSKPLKILHLEDLPTDSEIIKRELRKLNIEFSLTHVDTEEDFLQGLEKKPDLILADYTLPNFDGLTALALTRKQNEEIPFIFVSATLGEEVAIEALKHGATDYVLKQRLSRLIPVLQRALKEVEDAKERKRVERLKGELLSILAHELHTPLSVFQEGLSQLSEGVHGELTVDQKECCGDLAEATNRLITLSQKVFLAAELMSNEVEFNPTKINLTGVIKNVADSLGSLAKDKGVRLEINTIESVEVNADAKYLKKALFELGENAIHATPKDKEVTLSCSSANNHVQLLIEDEGCGFPKDEFNGQLDQFQFVGGTDDRKTGGLGLGLFIASALIKGQEGELEISSKPNQGTRIQVILNK